MATETTQPAPAPKPAHRKFDPLRPLRYGAGFLGGTVNSTLNSMASWGHKGMWLGLGIATLAMISGVTGGLGLLVMGWAAGLAGGAVAGGAVGLVTGGIRGVNREVRKEKYSEDLLERARAASKPAPRTDYRDAYREHKHHGNRIVDRILNQQREVTEQVQSFQDRVTNSRSHSQHSGLGW